MKSRILSGRAISQKALCVCEYTLRPIHETQSPSASIAQSYMPQLFTASSFRLCSADGQKSDFYKSHFRREYKMLHSFWSVKVWQSGIPCRH